MKEKMQTITFWTVCIFLFCYFLRILNFSNELIVVLGGALCLILLVQQKKLRIDTGICMLTIALLSYYVITNGLRGILFSILYIPLLVYELGNYSASILDKSEEQKKKLIILIMVMVVGYTIHGILNSYMYYAGYVVPGTRRWKDFWSGEIVPGTQHSAYFLPALALILPSVRYFKKRKCVNILLVLSAVFFGYTSLVTKSRMSVLIFVLVFAAQTILLVWLEKEQVKKMILNNKIRTVAIVFLLTLVATVFVLKDNVVVVSFIENMSKGGGILNNVRFKAQRMALQQIFLYPMGGNLMDLGGISHSHNTWLDMANAAGVIPFFSFALYAVNSFYELICLLFEKEAETEIKIVLSGLYFAFFLYLSVEPALEASIHLVTPWIFINGLIHGYLLTLKKRTKA